MIYIMTNEMKYIYELYKTKSFSKAAEKLFITQPALSICVQKVEKDLGMPIFYRNKKVLSLTEAGEKYIQAIEHIDFIEKNMYDEINDLKNLNSGYLTIGGTQYINSYILPPVICRFYPKYPNIKIQIQENPSNRLLDALENGQIDLTFNCSEIDKSKFTVSHAFYDWIVLAVPSHFVSVDALPYALTKEDLLFNAHVLPMRPHVPLQLFANIPFIFLTEGNNLYERTESFIQQANIHPPVALDAAQMVTAFNYCCSGIGATFISAYLISQNSPKNMYYFKIDSPLCVRNFQSILNQKRHTSLVVKAFLNEFCDVYSEDSSHPWNMPGLPKMSFTPSNN